MAEYLAQSTGILVGEKTRGRDWRTLDEISTFSTLTGSVRKYLRIEAFRLATFKNFPTINKVSAVVLAANGFIYIGEGSDESVLCIFCNLVKSDWTPGDVVSEVHRNLSPNCPIVTRLIGRLKQPKPNHFNCASERSRQAAQQVGAANESTIETDAAPDFAHARTNYHNRSHLTNFQFAESSVAKPLIGSSRETIRIPRNVSAEVRSNTLLVSQVTAENPQSTAQNNNTNGSQSQTLASAIENARESLTSRPEPHPQATGNSSGNVAPTNNETRTSESSTNSQTNTDANNSQEVPTEGHGGAAAALELVSTNSGGSNNPAKKQDPTYADLGIITERPKRTEYAIKIKRLETLASWPRDHHLRPEELADAGFYYAGYGDCARCFFCGGGLRNWEDEDDVWVEHARWFPKCAYIRQQVGQVFVDTVQELTKQIEQIPFNIVIEKMGVAASAFRIGSKTAPLQSDPAVQAVIELGYLEKDVLDVASRIREESNLLSSDAIVNKLREENYRKSTKSGQIVPHNKQPEYLDHELFRKLKESNNQLRQQIVCKICLDKDVAVVFLPCGHLVSCTDCALAMKDCPVCRNHVRGTVRAFIA